MTNAEWRDEYLRAKDTGIELAYRGNAWIAITLLDGIHGPTLEEVQRAINLGRRFPFYHVLPHPDEPSRVILY